VRSPKGASAPSASAVSADVREAATADAPAVDDAEEELPPLPERSVWALTKEGIDGGMKEILLDILGCYQAALEEFPDLEGGFTVGFTVDDVDGLGEVVEVEIRDSDNDLIEPMVDGPMEECVMDHIGSLQFDPPADGRTTVNYPFRFSPG
jgi:hypothetical protein